MKYLALLLLCGVANAQTPPPCAHIADNRIHVCYTRPATFVDLTAVPSTAAITYDVELQTSTGWTKAATGLTATDWTSGALPPATYTYRVLAFVSGTASDPAVGNPKATTTEVLVPPAPVVVAQVTVTVSHAIAYRVLSTGNLSSAAYALVPLGRPCYGPIQARYRKQSYRFVNVLPAELLAGDSTANIAAPCS